MSTYKNIGRTDDPAYRYRMPCVIGKVEGRGNGIKTVIANIVEVADALHRDPDEVVKFMGCELGAQTIFKFDQERFIVNGAHKDDVLQDLVDLYVDKFVLCPTCKYPETSYKYKLKRDEIFHKCKACGARDPLVDETHRLCKFILTKEKNRLKKEKKDNKNKDAKKDKDKDDKEAKKAKKAEKKAKKKAKKEKKKAKKAAAAAAKKASSSSSSGAPAKADSASNDGSNDDEVWASEGADPILQDSTIDTVSPAEAVEKASATLSSYVTQGKDVRFIIDKLGSLQQTYRLKPNDRCGLLFTGVFSSCKAPGDVVKAFGRFTNVFRQLVAGNENELLGAIDRHFTNAANAKMLMVVPLILNLFFVQELISEKAVRQWQASSEPLLDRYGMVEVGALEAVKAKAKLFLDKLDEESDSSSDSDSSD